LNSFINPQDNNMQNIFQDNLKDENTGTGKKQRIAAFNLENILNPGEAP
jgi:hypothetical protein